MLEIDNREKILDSTIELLMKKGYEKLTMRDIARKTGIKASSIYNHFENKSQIIDEVIKIFEDELQQRKINDYEIDLEMGDVPAVLLYIMTKPLELFEDPYLAKIIKILTEGQHYHTGIRDFLIKEMFDKPLRLIKSTLSKLIDLNMIKPLPVDFLAAELQSVFVASFYRISLSGDILEINLDDIYRGLEMHVAFFYNAAKR